MKYDKFNRRMFLQGAGGVLLSIPFLESLLTKEALAQVATPLKRYMFIQTPNQMHPEWFSPSRSVFGSNDIIIPGSPYRSKLLLDILNQTGMISTLIGNQHENLLGHINIIRSLDLYGRLDHGDGHVHGNVAASKDGLIIDFSGGPRTISQAWSPTSTIDNVLVESGSVYGEGNPSLPTLNLGQVGVSMRYDDGQKLWQQGEVWDSRNQRGVNSQGYTGGSLGLSFNSNPRLIIENMFSNLGSLPDQNNSPAESTNFSRKKAIDLVISEFRTVFNGRKIASTDRLKLERHFDTLNEISNNSQNNVPGNGSSLVSCSPPVQSNFINLDGDGNTSSETFADVNKYWQDMASLASSALLCNVTRVVNLRYHSSVATGAFRAHAGSPRTWHLEDAHMHINDNLIAHGRYVVDNIFMPIVNALNSVDESNGSSYLDNSLIWYAPESSYGHGSAGYSILTAGSAGNKLETGRFIDYGDPSITSTGTRGESNGLHIGLPMNRWWVTILQSFGLSPSDYENSYGNQNRPDGSRGYGLYWQNSGGYESWFSNDQAQTIRTSQFQSIGDPLPGLFKP